MLYGKEVKKRISERYGKASQNRPKGNIIWIHAASVGEATIALTVINALNKSLSTIDFLVTSGTVASAQILHERLPINAIHQFVPLDNAIFVRKFLRHWQPNLGLFIESELWPCLLHESAKYCKLLLLNARISDNSFKKWQKAKLLFQILTSYFNLIIVSSDRDFKKFAELGVKTINLGNIKYANAKLDVPKEKLLLMRERLQGKKIVVLASTHAEDERIILPLITKLKAQCHNCYLIDILRHPERRGEIAKQCIELGLKYSFRSEKQYPLLDDDLYIVDSFGELGLFYALSDITFIGGSFKHGGHNPIEATYFNNIIIFGPDMNKCHDIAISMIKQKAAIQINSGQDLFCKLQYLLSGRREGEIMEYGANSLKLLKSHQQILVDYLAIINPYCNDFVRSSY
jgi:3-deoxy-D-manno-octulosonic-acid transferase